MPEQLLEKFCVLVPLQPANRFLLVKRWNLMASQGNHESAEGRAVRRPDSRVDKTAEESGLLPQPRPSADTAMFTISPGDERALEEHGAGETAKEGV